MGWLLVLGLSLQDDGDGCLIESESQNQAGWGKTLRFMESNL